MWNYSHETHEVGQFFDLYYMDYTIIVKKIKSIHRLVPPEIEIPVNT